MKRYIACFMLVLSSSLGTDMALSVEPIESAGNKEPLLTPGQTSSEIKAPGKNGGSYHVYLPTEYTAERKWPVLFVMSPGGGNAETLKRYIDGAEKNNWILAVSVQSRNGFSKSEDAVLDMVGDVCKRLPIDPKRMYSSGMSGGARMAFWLSEEMKSKGFAGVLACGAGGTPSKMSSKTVVVGLCGSNCFNRWDMACTFKGLKNNDSILRFFPGGHDWAESDLITYGMFWLNGCFLETKPPANTASAEEKQRFLSKVLEEIEKNKESDPERAYDWAICPFVDSVSAAPAASPPLPALMKNPKVQLYIAGLKEMDSFVKKHFATSSMDYLNHNGTVAAKRDADKLAEKYKGTKLAGLFTKLGEPSIAP